MLSCINTLINKYYGSKYNISIIWYGVARFGAMGN